jgi:hypothetical protein
MTGEIFAAGGVGVYRHLEVTQQEEWIASSADREDVGDLHHSHVGSG